MGFQENPTPVFRKCPPPFSQIEHFWWWASPLELLASYGLDGPAIESQGVDAIRCRLQSLPQAQAWREEVFRRSILVQEA